MVCSTTSVTPLGIYLPQIWILMSASAKQSRIQHDMCYPVVESLEDLYN